MHRQARKCTREFSESSMECGSNGPGETPKGSRKPFTLRFFTSRENH